MINSISELSITYPDYSYVRLFSLSEKRVLALEIPEAPIRRFVYDALLMTKTGIYLPGSVENYNAAVYCRAGMKKCAIRVKMTSSSEERTRSFCYEDPGKTDFLSAAMIEAECCIRQVNSLRKRFRGKWTPAVTMNKELLARRNLNELRRAKRTGGVLCVCEAEELQPCCIKEIVHYRKAQLVILCEKYSHFRWRVPRLELFKTSLL